MGLMVGAAVLLTLYDYFGTQAFFFARVAPAVPGVGAWEGFLYSALASVTVRLVLPLAVIVLLLRESPREYGFRLPERGHVWPYVALFLGMAPVLAAVSFLSGFQRTYPVFPDAYRSAGDAALFLGAYALRFAAVEAFFRGFLLFALHRRFGYHAVAIMMIPYCMIHFDKPFPEAIGSIFAGLLLGFLALRSRSWIPGAILHWAIAVTMDVVGLMQRG